MKKIKMPSIIKNTIGQYISNNLKEYILVLIIFLIGIFIGVMFINNCSEEQETSVISYINEFIEKFKTMENFANGFNKKQYWISYNNLACRNNNNRNACCFGNNII